MKKRFLSGNALRWGLAATFAACLSLNTQGQVLFEDNLDSDSSANWNLFAGYYEGSATDDYRLQWGFDYSSQTYNLFTDSTTSTELKVPPAPNSKGTTRGLKIAVNKFDDLPERIAINLYPKGKSFSGNYSLKFDCFMNHGSFADEGGGTTEYLLAGINHAGDRVNWGVLASGAVAGHFLAEAVGRNKSDGLWFGFVADGGAAQDFYAWEGTGDGPPKYLAGTSGGIPDRDGNGTADFRDFDPFYISRFPAPPFELPGMLGKRWLQVEISQFNDVITWKIDGVVIARRANASPWKNGNIMIGYTDPFTSISTLRDETWVIIDNVRVETASRQVLVTTADNASPANDGKTSLLEALTDLRDGDRIEFNIPGDGPHTIVTPLGGYPLITKKHVTIDGYSQPGAAPNSASAANGNNAKIKIVLDSSGEEQRGDPAKPDRRSTRLPYPGYGDSENAILGLLNADFVTIRGLSFASRHTPGSDEDPSIYGIALVNGSDFCTVQGNWFGVLPDGKTIKGSAAAVAGFRHRVSVDGANVDTFSRNLTVGVDGDGDGDAGEGNVLAGQHIALALELPQARIAGNFFNLLPDGKTFLSADNIHNDQLASGRPANDSSVENIENGRFTDSSVIGTDGDGSSDSLEGNVFGQVIYDHLIEFYSNARNLTVSGNFFGASPAGTTAPAPTVRVPSALIEIPGASSLLFGSNHDGRSDAAEGNTVRNATGAVLIGGGGKDARITVRRNSIANSAFESFPFPDSGARNYAEYYAPVVQDPAQVTPVLESYSGNILKGSVPAFIVENFPHAYIDVYLATSPAGSPATIPGTYLGTFTEGSDLDQDAADGKFAFDLAGLAVPGGAQLVVAVSYSTVKVTPPAISPTDAGFSVTGPVSNAVATGGAPSPIQITTVRRDGVNVRLSWTGGKAPYKVQSRSSITATTWSDVLTTSETTGSVPAAGNAGFLRILGTP